MQKPADQYQELIQENALLKEKIRELQGSGISYKTLFASATEGILVAERETRRFRHANPALCEMFGYKAEEILQLQVADIHPKNSLAHVLAEFDVLSRGKRNWALDIPCLHKNGSVFYANISSTTLVLDGVKCNVGFFTNITDRKQTEDALRRNEEILRLITDNMSDMIRVTDLQGVNLYQSPSHFKQLGYKPEDRVGKSAFDIVCPEDMERCINLYSQALTAEKPITAEYRVRHADGHYVWLESVGDILKDSKGDRTAIIICSRDISDRKKMETELVKSEKRYRDIIKDMQEAYYEGDLAGRFTFINDALCKSIGYTAEEVIGKSYRNFQDEVTARKFYQAFNQVYKTGKPRQGIETVFTKKDGSLASFEISALLRRDAYGKPVGFAGVAIDVTVRKQAEEALRLSEENFRRSLDDSPLGARIVSVTGETIYANRTLLDIYGYPGVEELRATPTKERYTPESYQEFLERRQKRRQGEFVPSEYEVSIFRKDGEIRHLQAFRKEILWNGAPQFQILYNDITDRKKAEEEKQNLQERLNRAEKMEVLGRMAGGVAHDLNNVLGVLTGYSELLLMELPEGQRARDNAEKIMQSTKKGAAIVQDLLTLARRGVTASEVINLNSVVSGFLKTPVFENLKEYHPQVEFHAACDNHLLHIKGSSVHLEKTLINLVSNAAESIAQKGQVTIRTENRYLDKPIRGYDEIKEGDYVVLMVSDTGTGIPAESRGKIFEPFYTKKTMGRSGTGLGLSIVWGTVKDHNGYIDVRTKVGEGTTFTLYFPVTRDEMAASHKKEPIEQYMGNGESVLVVDDIAEQRDVASAMLVKLGYKVHAVSGGKEAVEYLGENQADILVLDMIMAPGIDGLETYQRALEINPKQKAIIVSGYSETERVRKAQKLGAGAYIRKPYVMETIGLALRDELKK